MVCHYRFTTGYGIRYAPCPMGARPTGGKERQWRWRATAAGGAEEEEEEVMVGVRHLWPGLYTAAAAPVPYPLPARTVITVHAIKSPERAAQRAYCGVAVVRRQRRRWRRRAGVGGGRWYKPCAEARVLITHAAAAAGAPAHPLTARKTLTRSVARCCAARCLSDLQRNILSCTSYRYYHVCTVLIVSVVILFWTKRPMLRFKILSFFLLNLKQILAL